MQAFYKLVSGKLVSGKLLSEQAGKRTNKRSKSVSGDNSRCYT